MEHPTAQFTVASRAESNAPVSAADRTPTHDVGTTRWLVTGGAGFIGSALVRQLVSETEVHVLTVDSLTYAGNLASLGDALAHPRHRFVQADVADGAQMRALLGEFRPQVVVHLAAETHVDRSIDNAAAFVQTNIVGTYTLLEAIRAYTLSSTRDEAAGFRLLYVSTDEVFGSATVGTRFDEGSQYNPSSPYAASKASADHLVRAWHHTYDMPALITNCSNNYGPYQFPEKLIPLMISKAIAGEPMPVYGDGLQVRDWLHVDDHARALRDVVARGLPGRTYAVGARCERTNLDVVRLIGRVLDELRPLHTRTREQSIQYVADRPGHDRRYAIDPSRIESEIGWRPRYDFESGMRQTIEWYLDNHAWLDAVTSGAYRGQRLGLGVVT